MLVIFLTKALIRKRHNMLKKEVGIIANQSIAKKKCWENVFLKWLLLVNKTHGLLWDISCGLQNINKEIEYKNIYYIILIFIKCYLLSSYLTYMCGVCFYSISLELYLHVRAYKYSFLYYSKQLLI